MQSWGIIVAYTMFPENIFSKQTETETETKPQTMKLNVIDRDEDLIHQKAT